MYPIKRILVSVLVAAALAFAWAACDAPTDNGGIGTSPSEPVAPPEWTDYISRCTCLQVTQAPTYCPACVMLWRKADDSLSGGVFPGRCEAVVCCYDIQQ